MYPGATWHARAFRANGSGASSLAPTDECRYALATVHGWDDARIARSWTNGPNGHICAASTHDYTNGAKCDDTTSLAKRALGNCDCSNIRQWWEQKSTLSNHSHNGLRWWKPAISVSGFHGPLSNHGHLSVGRWRCQETFSDGSSCWLCGEPPRVLSSRGCAESW